MRGTLRGKIHLRDQSVRLDPQRRAVGVDEQHGLVGKADGDGCVGVVHAGTMPRTSSGVEGPDGRVPAMREGYRRDFRYAERGPC